MRFQHEASLHEKTVQSVARDALNPVVGDAKVRHHKTTLTRYVRVNPVLLSYVRRLVRGDMSRVTIINERQVLVKNKKGI